MILVFDLQVLDRDTTSGTTYSININLIYPVIIDLLVSIKRG